jgi:hypothetical protein
VGAARIAGVGFAGERIGGAVGIAATGISLAGEQTRRLRDSGGSDLGARRARAAMVAASTQGEESRGAEIAAMSGEGVVKPW